MTQDQKKGKYCILQVIPEMDAGGAERTVIEICEALTKRGDRALVASQGGRLEDELNAAGGELIRMDAASKNPFTLRKNRRALIDIARKERVDLIHARSRAPAWSALWAARALKTPYVTTHHGMHSDKTALKRLYNSVMARGDLVIANSEFTADYIRKTYETPDDRLITIPRGVDLEHFDERSVSKARKAALARGFGISPDKTIITLPGRLTEWKGQKLLIEALSGLGTEERANLQVLLVGDAQGRDQYKEELVELIRTANLDEIVKITGHCRDMPSLFALTDLMIAPSMRPEAFGRVAAEAQAMGVPVIAADHGGQRETVIPGETGWRFEPGNAAALTNAIGAFLNLSADEKAAFSQRATSWARSTFSKTALQSATLGVYDRLLQGGQTRS